MKTLSKETFCKVLELIQEQDRINEEFSRALQTVGNGFIAFGTENKFYKALIMVLTELLEDKAEYIEWWLYEADDDYTVPTVDGSQKWDLREPGALYDYLTDKD